MRRDRILSLPATIATFAFVALMPSGVLAHCDGMDGPVVKAARQALDIGNVNLAVVWVQPSDEAELRKAFVKTMAVRSLNSEAQELADLYFFETLVRLHRAGEGEAYTGLKPAGRDLGPAIPAADKALEDGSAGALLKMVNEVSAVGIQERFEKALATRKFSKEDIRRGRSHVKAYVEFVHYLEALYSAASGSRQEHFQSSENVTGHHSH